MTNEQRLEQFRQLLLEAQQKTGVIIRPFIRDYGNGERRADVELALIADWQPAEQAEE